MLEYLNQRDSLVWVFFEKLVDEVFVFLRDLAFESNLRTSLVSSNSFLISAVGCVSMDELVKQNSECPNVKLVVVPSVIYHFWSHVFESSAKSVPLPLELLTVLIGINFTFTCPAEVAYFENVVFINQEILRLKISVNETVLVQKVYASDCLNEEVKGCLFTEAALFLDQDKEVAFCNILHNEIDVLVVLQISIHAHDVHML